ncbi:MULTISPECIES: methyltransferase domain-containing protein [unclassified Myroides]|uniref:methyltransferase domain-containing protein n=1 Tax=unclassified Myroides TaxID=2642485 RepID=UPI003D2F90B6
MTKILNKKYWEDRYNKQEATWNAKAITTPLKAYIDQLTMLDAHILVPGLGHGHELLYLHRQGFSQSVGLDFTAVAFEETAKVHADFPVNHVVIGDFFEHRGRYDLILEQTFFCSLPVDKRKAYVKQMHALLQPHGKLVGVLFDAVFEQDTPPFGGNEQTYRQLFEPYFTIEVMERAYNSIKPRQNRELFIILKKKI